GQACSESVNAASSWSSSVKSGALRPGSIGGTVAPRNGWSNENKASNGPGGTRTLTEVSPKRILSPPRLPFRHGPVGVLFRAAPVAQPGQRDLVLFEPEPRRDEGCDAARAAVDLERPAAAAAVEVVVVSL